MLGDRHNDTYKVFVAKAHLLSQNISARVDK